MPKPKPRSKRAERDSAFYRRIIPPLLPVDTSGESRRRLQLLLLELKRQGVSQLRLADVTGLPAQYICDVKHGRRAVGELFARRIQDVCGINFQWLLGLSDDRTPAKPTILLTLQHP